MTETNPREIKGKEIALRHDLKRINDSLYHVKSQTTQKNYNVVRIGDKFVCDCSDHTFRKVCCKHIHAVEFSIKIREEVKEKTKITIQPVTIDSCLFCKSKEIKKYGIRHNKNYDIQRFVCQSCHKTFSVNIGFEKMKHNPKGITMAMQLYFSGESLRNVSKSLKLIGMDITHQTVYNWIKKYTELLEKYIETITPQVSDTWRSDELFLKFSGNIKYMYALLDDETRYLIAQQVANTKFKEDIRGLFREGQKVAGKKPKVLITDGARNFHQAYMAEYWTRPIEDRTVHISHIHFKGDMNNNKMERLNGEIRDREKTMRGLKKMDTPILKGYEIFHNYIRAHEGLNGKTPSEACGIEVNGENKWITLIQNASTKSGND